MHPRRRIFNVFVVILQAVTKFIVKYFVETSTENRIIHVNKSSSISFTTAADSSNDPGSNSIPLFFAYAIFCGD